MKLKFYLSSALSLCVLASMGQDSSVKKSQFTDESRDIYMDGAKTVVLSDQTKGGGEPEVFWSEDFSNGFDGTDENGAWTLEGAQGGFWFISYPEDATDGYDNTAPLTTTSAYGDLVPNFWGTGVTIPSTTADNGFAMLDCDRFNSITTDPDMTGVDFLTSNPIDASLTSPAIDLTGVTSGVLSFWQQWRMCCGGYNIVAEFSVDGGNSWFLYDLFALNNGEGNVTVSNNFGINITDALQSAADLSDCRVRFTWDNLSEGAATHYFMMIDDVNIVAVPDNDITIGETYFNNHFEAEFLNVEVDTPPVDLDYLGKLEYWNQPNYITRPFNFAAPVTNSGALEQTNITLTVTAFLDGVAIGTPLTNEVPINLAVGQTDTIRIYDQTPDWWMDPAPGVYTFEYVVEQEAEDSRPDDNTGTTRSTRISTDADNDGFAIMQNDRNTYTNFYPAETAPELSEDVIFANRQVFTEPDLAAGDNAVITHVEFCVAGTDQASTVPGEEVFVNVRTGSVVSELTDENPNFRYFDEDEVSHVIAEEDLTTGGAPTWISVELPTPILIEPGVIFQAEMEVPSIGVPSVFICLSNGQEFGSGVLYNITDPGDTPQGWEYTGESVPMVRFRTSYVLSTDMISYESGIKLTQNYPNPVVDNTMIQFQLDESSAVTFEVFDITGKLVYSDDLGNVPAMSSQIIDFSRAGLSSGTYTYGVVTETERLTRKMIIQ